MFDVGFFSLFWLITWLILEIQILKDDATREQYDYAIAHPEEVNQKPI